MLAPQRTPLSTPLLTYDARRNTPPALGQPRASWQLHCFRQCAIAGMHARMICLFSPGPPPRASPCLWHYVGGMCPALELHTCSHTQWGFARAEPLLPSAQMRAAAARPLISGGGKVLGVGVGSVHGARGARNLREHRSLGYGEEGDGAWPWANCRTQYHRVAFRSRGGQKRPPGTKARSLRRPAVRRDLKDASWRARARQEPFL